MLEKNQRFKSLLYVLADAALLFIGFLLANYIRFNYVRYFEPGGAGPALAVARDPRNIIAGLATSLVLVLIYWVAGIYSTTRLRGLAERCTKIAVINAAGVHADEIHDMLLPHAFTITPRRGEYCLCDKNAGNLVDKTIFQLPTKLGKGILVTPTVHGNLGR